MSDENLTPEQRDQKWLTRLQRRWGSWREIVHEAQAIAREEAIARITYVPFTALLAEVEAALPGRAEVTTRAIVEETYNAMAGRAFQREVDVEALSEMICSLRPFDRMTSKTIARAVVAHLLAQPAKPADRQSESQLASVVRKCLWEHDDAAKLFSDGQRPDAPATKRIREALADYDRARPAQGAHEVVKLRLDLEKSHVNAEHLDGELRHMRDERDGARNELRERTEKAEADRDRLQKEINEATAALDGQLHHNEMVYPTAIMEACAAFAAVAQMLPERAFTDEITTLPDAVRALIEQGDGARNELAQVREDFARVSRQLAEANGEPWACDPSAPDLMRTPAPAVCPGGHDCEGKCAERAQAGQEVTTENVHRECQDSRLPFKLEASLVDAAEDDIRANLTRAVNHEANRCQAILSENEADWHDRCANLAAGMAEATKRADELEAGLRAANDLVNLREAANVLLQQSVDEQRKRADANEAAARELKRRGNGPRVLSGDGQH